MFDERTGSSANRSATPRATSINSDYQKNTSSANLLAMGGGMAQFFTERAQGVRSWTGEFLNKDQFELPQNQGASDIKRRISGNLAYFQSNYLVVAAVLFVFVLITHLLLAIFIAGLGISAIAINSLPADFNLVVAGLVFTKKTFLFGVGFVALLTLLVTDVGSAFFWLLGMAALIITAHAALHLPSGIDQDITPP